VLVQRAARWWGRDGCVGRQQQMTCYRLARGGEVNAVLAALLDDCRYGRLINTVLELSVE